MAGVRLALPLAIREGLDKHCRSLSAESPGEPGQGEGDSQGRQAQQAQPDHQAGAPADEPAAVPGTGWNLCSAYVASTSVNGPWQRSKRRRRLGRRPATQAACRHGEDQTDCQHRQVKPGEHPVARQQAVAEMAFRGQRIH